MSTIEQTQREHYRKGFADGVNATLGELQNGSYDGPVPMELGDWITEVRERVDTPEREEAPGERLGHDR